MSQANNSVSYPLPSGISLDDLSDNAQEWPDAVQKEIFSRIAVDLLDAWLETATDEQVNKRMQDKVLEIKDHQC